MHTLNDKTRERYALLTNKLSAAQRDLQEFLMGVVLAMGLDPAKVNFDPRIMSFVDIEPASTEQKSSDIPEA